MSALLTLFATAPAGGGGGFSPLDLSPLAWWDFTDRSSLNAGVAPALGDPIDDALDKSGNSETLTAYTGTTRPLVVQDGSGVYAARFDGIDDRMLAPAASNIMAGLTQATVFVVAKENSTALVNALWRYGDGSTQGSCYLYAFQGDAVYAGLYGGNKLEAGTTGPGLNLTVLTQRFDLSLGLTSAQATRQRFNGVDKSLSFIGSAPSDSIVVPLGNQQLEVGYLPPYRLDADVYQIIIYAGILTDAECADVEAYLTAQCQV